MNDIWTNRLSEYLDGELDSAEQAALEAHLATCGACYATLGELKHVVARAKALPDTPPVKDLWAGIRAGITPAQAAVTARPPVRPSARRFAFSVPQLLAASIALALLSGGGVWIASRPQATKAPDTVLLPPSREAAVRQVVWTRNTDAAIADLQTALTQNETKLDTATVRIVRQNLAIIDRAITDARVALQKDPGNAYLNLHLADTMRRKVELLRRVNAMAART
ncbi:MAG TPA: zf-HC2 domain-containing protein [Gemmatimonadales bacterium]|jgi:anti-sigma factor RsiW|nr:zf-HC2 domain-containing protein [Gemmatimonadales bacterium]